MTPAELAAARHDLLTVGADGIETATARAWLARALAAYGLAVERRCPRWLHEAAGYAGEALEHAAQVGDGGGVLCQVDAALAPAREAAFRALGA